LYITPANLRVAIGQVAEKYRHDQARIINAISLNLNEELLRARITTLDKLAFFLALIATDSSNLSLLEEPREGISTFCARGLLKIEGVENYKKFGGRLGLDLESSHDCRAEFCFIPR
jgi:predicted chitinase